MPNPSRRAILQVGAALGAMPFTKGWPAKAMSSATRYSVFSPEGKKALASYANAVAAMVQLSEKDPTDPLGWIYQYKIHGFPENGYDILVDEAIPLEQRLERLDKAKEAELDKYFGPAANGNVKRAHAAAIWGKCPHSDGVSFAADFFPWHRMYLFFFERIVRKLSGDDQLALPYWGYMDGASSQILPPEFAAALPNPLAHGRSPNINNGNAMNARWFAGDFWAEPKQFEPFGNSAENAPHNPVHIELGTPPSQNVSDRFDMADPFRSPRDPIFWLHHCEIDRIWEGGRHAGFPVPEGVWLSQTHHFFDENRNFVELTNADVLNSEQIKNWPGYKYDRLPAPPAQIVAISMDQSSERTERRTIAPQTTARRTLATAFDVKLRSGLHTTRLAPTAAITDAERTMESARTTGGRRTISMEVSDVTLSQGAVANVGLYLNAPAGASGEQLEKFFVGTVSTFSLLPEGIAMDHGTHEAKERPPKFVFNVTRLVDDLEKQGLWSGEPKLTTKEIVGSLGGATLKLGNVKLVETTAELP